MTGKLGRALVGEWHGAWYGICILPGFVRLDLGVVGGLDDDGEEVVGVVSFNPT